MNDFAAFHDELRVVARELLGAAASRTAGGEPVVVGAATLAEAGWLGLEVPEALGGAGATFAELAVVAEELGRAAAISPHLGSAVLGVPALLAAGRDDLLAAVASGEVTVAVALPTGDDPAPPFRIEEGVVHGVATFVPDAVVSDVVVLVADGAIVVAEGPAERLAVTPTEVLDGRGFGTVVAEGCTVDAAHPVDDDVVAELLRRGTLATAVDSVGIAAAMLEATVTYAKERKQFDRQIGSFQAVKHQLADRLVQLTLSRELAAAAVADPTDDVAVSMAKAHATAMAVDVAGTALQLHGGIGYTWEGPVHRHLKRAMLNRSLFGSPRAHRARLAARYSSAAPTGGADPSSA